MGEKRLGGFLARHGYGGGKRRPELLARLHAPRGRAGELGAEVRGQVVLGLVVALKPLVEQIEPLTSEIRGLLAAQSDGPLFRSLFPDARATSSPPSCWRRSATGARYPASEPLEALGGQRAIAIESSKHKVGTVRWPSEQAAVQCRRRPRRREREPKPWAQKLCAKASARRNEYPHAPRILGRAWLRVIWRLRPLASAYNAGRHGSLNRLLAGRG